MFKISNFFGSHLVLESRYVRVGGPLARVSSNVIRVFGNSMPSVIDSSRLLGNCSRTFEKLDYVEIISVLEGLWENPDLLSHVWEKEEEGVLIELSVNTVDLHAFCLTFATSHPDPAVKSSKAF